MAAINFPSNPINGQLLTVGTNKYSYNSTYGTWDVVANVVEGPPGKFILSAIAPTNPIDGQTWFNTSATTYNISPDESIIISNIMGVY